MVKDIFIYIENDEYFDDAQLLARSFFSCANVQRKNIRYDNEEVRNVFLKENNTVLFIIADRLIYDIQVDKTRGELHDIFKKNLYSELVNITGKTLPWGFLTGVRPAKRIKEITEKNPHISAEAATKKFMSMYMVRKDRASLAFEVAKNERVVLEDKEIEDRCSVYVGIPFCPSICNYCSFGSIPLTSCNNDIVEAYIDALCIEIKKTAALTRDKYRGISSVYFGGGTPTSLSPAQLEKIILCLIENFDIKGAYEFCIEAGRPDSITKEKLEILKKYGVNRISINPQTMNDDTLKKIGRMHTSEDVHRAFEDARALGFDNINTDIILGLPGENVEDVEMTMQKISCLMPESITSHVLAYKRASYITREKVRIPVSYNSGIEEMSDKVMAFTKKLNLTPYYMYRQQNMEGNLENIGYAKEGKASVYNIVMMGEIQDILALGAGASSKFLMGNNRYERAINVKSVNDYISRTDEMIERKRSLLFEKNV